MIDAGLRRRRARRNRVKGWLHALTGSRPCPVCEGLTLPAGASWMHSHLRCAACGMLTVAELPTLENLARSYGRVHLSNYQVQHKQDWEAFSAHKQRTLDLLGVDRLERRLDSAGGGRPRALDLGCGEGALLQVLERRGWEAWGLELCPPLARRARQQGSRAVAGSLEGPPPARGSMPERYSLVLMNHLLEHLRDPLAALVRVRALLQPQGRLLLETPLQPDLDNIDHLHCFSAAALERALVRCGYRALAWFDYVDDNYRHHNLACLARPSI